MRACPACGSRTAHSEGGYHCTSCDYSWQEGRSHRNRRHERRYKKVIRRLDRIGARLANVRW